MVGLWRHLTHGLYVLLHREAADRDIADEVRQYMEAAEADLVAAGASSGEARRAVRLKYGDAAAAREEVRAYGWESLVESVAADVRYGLRRLRRSPGFTAVAVVVLGIGIGSATTIFSAVNPVLLEALPYPHAERLVQVADRSDGSAFPVTFGTFRELEERSRSFAALAVLKAWQPTVTGQGEPERLEGERVSAGYFRVLGSSPAMGRAFDGADDRAGGPNVVILSDGLWRRRFGADSAIVGRQVQLDGASFTVLGVMPSGFKNLPGHPAAAWAPLQYDASLPSFGGREWGHHLEMVGRLRAGVALQSARDELDALAAHPVPEIARPAWASLRQGFVVRSLKAAATADVRPALLALVGAVLLLLLIACVNVANLVLARGTRRRGELAMRAALGAPRRRLVRQLLTESLLLAAAGGALGVALAGAGVAGLAAVAPPELPGLAAMAVNRPALLFAVALTTLLGVVVGLVPALGGSRGALSGAVREAGGRTVKSHAATRRALVVVEVALALVLLVGAGLLLRSVRGLFAVPPGFDASRVMVMQVQTSPSRFGDDDAVHRFFDDVLDAVRRVPGVASAALTSQLPLSGQSDGYGINFSADLRPSDQDHGAFRYVASPAYLQVMGIPLLRGRALNEHDDAGAPPVALVDEAFVQRAFPGTDPLGQRVHIGSPDQPPYTIVGVVGDVKQTSLGDAPADAFYVTPEQWYFADPALWLVVKVGAPGTGPAPSTLVPAIKRAVWSVGPDQAIVRAGTMRSLVFRSEAKRRFVMIIMEAFALLALVLAGVGLYGVLAGSVADRMREIGVRAALGASRENIVAMVVRQGMGLTGLGVAIGLAGAAAASTVLASLLFGVSRLDPLTYAAVVVVLGAVAALACWIPAVRAARVDPLSTLRVD